MRELKYFVKEIPYNLRKIRWFWQRGKRGWADCDWWNMNAYLIGIILPMLKNLRQNSHAYPGFGEADTPEKWDVILDQMIIGFEAGKRVSDDEYYLETNADILDREPTPDEIKLWGEKYRVDRKTFDDGMRLFSRWYWSLWD